ncbi:hypothetical protein BDW67DRAFT_192363 [Aspergillus spinulosporus]
MDLLNSRITFASMHAFEDVGVRELEEELARNFPRTDSHCEYSKAEDVLVIRGKLEGLAVQLTVFISSFIERNRNAGDLLELSTGVREEGSLVDDTGNSHYEGLLMSDDDLVTVIPHTFTQVTKFWLAAAGGVGCFAHEKHRDMLGKVARHTGTEIAIIDEIKGLQVSGSNEGDVNDALERLSRIETPLSCLDNPDIKNIAVGITESSNGWMIQAYEDLHPEAPHHVLTDPSMRRMFVTSHYTFNKKTGLFIPAKNLVEPPRCRYANEKSRLWTDFVFQEIGDGDNFTALELMAETNDAETQFVLTGAVGEHPYLSEKRKHVSEWVANVLDMGVTKAPLMSETPASSLHSAESVTKLRSHSGVKKAPGIKARRPIQSRADAIRSVPDAACSALLQGSDGLTMSHQKRWEMEYQFDASSTTNGQAAVTEVENHIGYDSPSSNESAASPLKPKSISHNPNEPGPASLSFSTAAAPASNIVITKSEIQILGESMLLISNRPLSEPHTKPALREDQLIDVNAAVKHTEVDLSMNRLEMAGLIGGRPVSSPGVEPMTFADGKLAVLKRSRVAKSTSVSGLNAPSSSTSEVFKEKQDARLESLNHKYSHHYAETSQNLPATPYRRPWDYSRILEERAIGGLERVTKPETVQSCNETKSRKYYWTMAQKAAKLSQKATSRTSSLAKKQATLEDAWGISSQKKPVDKWHGVGVLSGKGPRIPATAGTESTDRRLQHEKLQKESFDRDVGSIIVALKPIFKAAEAFPGIVTFELQFGLALIPLMPKTRNTNMISSAEWSEIFQPRNGMPTPTTKFVNRLTACGSEIDHIIDLRKSKAEGKSRMFEEEYSEYNICYEFHCRLNTDELLLIIIDEQGGFSIQNPKSSLGAVNIHFPHRVWDARAIIESAIHYRPGSLPEQDELARHLADHLWVPASQNICIYTSLPRGSKTIIEKVVMKRWTRHRFLGEGMRNESQDIFLQVTEVQDLFLGIQMLQGIKHVRARYTNPEEMIQRGKAWYELSLVSPTIETILETNEALEVGERTEEWCSADFLGGAELSTGQEFVSHKSSVATAIGARVVAQMVQVAKRVVEKMDGVGACNRGLMIPGALQMNKGLSHADIQSVKEVESVRERADPEHFDAVIYKREHHEQEYW